VRLALEHGKVAALVRAESQDTLELLERHLPELKAALADQGLAVGSFELELGLSAGGRSGRDAGRGEGRARGPQPGAPALADPRLAHLVQRLSPHAGGVDTYA
jgi:flagellar hook-length control protein FliK